MPVESYRDGKSSTQQNLELIVIVLELLDLNINTGNDNRQDSIPKLTQRFLKTNFELVARWSNVL